MNKIVYARPRWPLWLAGRVYYQQVPISTGGGQWFALRRRQAPKSSRIDPRP